MPLPRITTAFSQFNPLPILSTYLRNSVEQILEKLTVAQLDKKHPDYYGFRMLITVVHKSLSFVPALGQINTLQSSYPISLNHFNIIIPSRPRTFNVFSLPVFPRKFHMHF